MEFSWILLVLLSAATHPLRDLTLKGVAHPVSCYTGVCLSWVVFASFHMALTGQNPALPADVWPLVLASALGLTVYYYGTLSALRRGNVSAYYPIVRSSPLAIAGFSWLMLGQSYSVASLLGMGLIIWAGLMIQKGKGRLLDDPRAFAMAGMAMLGSAAYSISDATAMQGTSSAPFLFWSYFLVTLAMGALRAWEDRGQSAPLLGVVRGWTQHPWRILFAGLSSYLSYLLILRVFQLGAEAAAVSAVRQVSIPVSVILAALVLKEPRGLSRLGWAALIAAGIAMIALQ
ncbi:EamA family transporter [Leisingera sp. S232]|uniref:EamA family transporter n=1 Tax=Leisingera sp. S232 TaxID=3415132 RepID=UPI003C7B2994